MFRHVAFVRAGPLAGVTDPGELDRAEVIWLGDRCSVTAEKLYEGQPRGRVHFRCRVRWDSVRVYMLPPGQFEESSGVVRIAQPMRDITMQIEPDEVDAICRHLYFVGGSGHGRFLDERGHTEGETNDWGNRY